MSDEVPKDERQDYEIPCKLLAATELDMAHSISPNRRTEIPLGGFVRHEVALEPTEIDFSNA